MPLRALEALRDATAAEASRAPIAASPSDAAPPDLPPGETVPPETVPPVDRAPRNVMSAETVPPGSEVAPLAATGSTGPSGAAPGARKQLTAPIALVAIAITGVGIGVVSLVSGGPDGTAPAGGRLFATTSPGVATSSVTTASPSPVVRATESTPASPAAGAASAVPTATAETRDRVALRTGTPVAEVWRDSAGTVRVHIVVSATNDTSDVRSLAPAERSFRLISAAGRTVHTGRFAYAFPFVVPPGGTSHLITTVVLPVGVDATNLRVEAEILADVTTAVEPMLEVSDLRLVSSEGRPGVRGIVRNTGAEDVSFGVVAVIGRDASGRVVGGLYDNVNVASIAAGGEQVFQTEYPGLPPDAAGRIADLSGIAFDARTSVLSPTSLPSPTLTASPTITAPIAPPHLGTTEGCSAAFWAVRANFDLWQEHRPEDVVGAFFPDPVEYAQLTFADALQETPVEDVRRMLIRQATAALLNAAHDSLEYPYARYDAGIEGRPPIVPTVAELLRTGTTQAMAAFASELAVANQLGCPLR